MTVTTKNPSVGYPPLEQLRFEIYSSISKPIDIHSCFNQFNIKDTIKYV
jgi:hypothetical protein